MNEKGKMPLIMVIIIIVVLILVASVVTRIVISLQDNQNDENVVEENVVQTNSTTDENTTSNNEINLSSNLESGNLNLNFLKLEDTGENKNMIYSPLSIKYGLKMLEEGADGETKAQIERVLGDITLTKYISSSSVLSFANAVYIKDTYANLIKEEYTTALSDNYDAEVNYDSFESATNINNWIEEKTLNQISNLLSDDQVLDNKLILINALAIDMKWASQFDVSDTSGEIFYLEDGTEMMATTMRQSESKSENISYYIDDTVTALAMDLEEYDGTQLEFIAIMPEENLSYYVQEVTSEDIEKITSNLILASDTEAGLDITIPKFSYDYSLNFKDDLEAMGMTDAFDSELADFSYLSDTPFYVSDAIHKANIEFSEDGIKAAAVTAFLMADSAMLQESQPIEVTIDHPFMYIIRDKDTKDVWFVGTVYEPNSWEDDQADYQAQY